MEVLNLTQGSKAWLDIRKKNITSTDGCMVLNEKSWDRLKLSKEKPNTFKSYAMRRGSFYEKEAFKALEIRANLRYMPTVAYKPSERMLASLDGMAFGRIVTCEIKCPEKGVDSTLWKQVEKNKIPHTHQVQMQMGLLITQAKVCHYWIYDADLKKGLLVNVFPDLKMHKELIQSVRRYWQWEAQGISLQKAS